MQRIVPDSQMMRSAGVFLAALVACFAAFAEGVARYALDEALALDGMRGYPQAGAAADKIIQARTFFPFVDKYGQFMHDDWPGKIHSDEELAAQGKKEFAMLAAHPNSPIRDADKYGGWAGGAATRSDGTLSNREAGRQMVACRP